MSSNPDVTDSLAAMYYSNMQIAISHLNVHRQDLSVSDQVEKRLKELAVSFKTVNCKQKSLRSRSVEFMVPNRVTWPHEHVLSGSHMERVLVISNSGDMAGFCHIMR